MERYIIMCRSITAAQRCSRLLESSLIHAAVSRAPREISSNGCGYCLVLRNKLKQGVELLRSNNMPIGKIFSAENGEYREVSV